MKNLKLILGILSLVFSVMVMIQSCAAQLAASIAGSTDAGGTAGFLVALMFITGGIVMIVTRDSEKKNGSMACIIFYVIAALLGFSNCALYRDLIVWSTFSLILAAVSLIFILETYKTNKKNRNDLNQPDEE